MQASKIIPRNTYALQLTSDLLVRIDVTEVVTVQKRKDRTSSPHDYSSYIHGWIPKTDVPAGQDISQCPVVIGVLENDTNRLLVRVDPSKIVGSYEETVVLRERAAAEEKAKQDEKDAAQALAEKLRWKLRQLIGEDKVQRGTIGRTYDNGLNISKEAVAALVKALEL